MTVTHEMIYEKLVALEKRSTDRDGALAAIKENVDATKDIVEAWAAAKTFGKFIKWVSGIFAAVAVIVVGIKAFAGSILNGG